MCDIVDIGEFDGDGEAGGVVKIICSTSDSDASSCKSSI